MHRAQPVGNRILYTRAKKRARAKHQKRLQQMKASINTVPSVVAMSGGSGGGGIDGKQRTSMNKKGEYMKRERLHQVDRDNQLLLSKMRSIAKRTNQFISVDIRSSSSSSSTVPGMEDQERPTQHLEHGLRKRVLEIQRIETDNIRIAQRIESARGGHGSYSVVKLREEWTKNRILLDNVCSHPVIESLFGKKDGSSPRPLPGARGGGGGGGGRARVPQRPSTTEPNRRAARSSTSCSSRFGGLGRRNAGRNAGRAGRNVVDRQNETDQRRPNTTQVASRRLQKRNRPDNSGGGRRSPRPAIIPSETAAGGVRSSSSSRSRSRSMRSNRSNRSRMSSTNQNNNYQNILVTSPAMGAVLDNLDAKTSVEVDAVMISTTSAPSITWESNDVRIGGELFTVCGFGLNQNHGGILFEARSRSSRSIYRLTASKKNVVLALKRVEENEQLCNMLLLGEENEEQGRTTMVAEKMATAAATSKSSPSSSPSSNIDPSSVEKLARKCLRLRLMNRRLRLVLIQPEITEEMYEKQEAIIVIQKVSRGMLARKITKRELTTKSNAAKVVQKNQRGRQARCIVSKKKIKILKNKNAATRLQSQERGRQSRKYSSKLMNQKRQKNDAITKLQSTERGRQARKITTLMKSDLAAKELKEFEKQRLKVEERQNRHRLLIERRKSRESGEDWVENTAPGDSDVAASAAPAKSMAVVVNENVAVKEEAVVEKEEGKKLGNEETRSKGTITKMDLATEEEEEDEEDKEDKKNQLKSQEQKIPVTYNNRTAEREMKAWIREEKRLSPRSPANNNVKYFDDENEKEPRSPANNNVKFFDDENEEEDEEKEEEEEEEEEEHEAVVDLFESSYVFNQDTGAPKQEKGVVELTKTSENQDITKVVTAMDLTAEKVEEEEEEEEHEAVIDLFESGYVFNKQTSAVASKEEKKLLQKPDNKKEVEREEDQENKEEEDKEHEAVIDMFEQSYVFPQNNFQQSVEQPTAVEVVGFKKRDKDRSKSELDDDTMTISELLARSQGSEMIAEKAETQQVRSEMTISNNTLTAAGLLSSQSTSNHSVRIIKGITIMDSITSKQVHLLVTLSYLDVNFLHVAIYEPTMANLHVDVDFKNDKEKNNMERMDYKVMMEEIFPSLEIVSTNGIVTLRSMESQPPFETKQERELDKELEGEEEEEEEEEEYHIDVGQLDDNGLQAIRSNLDELFSEFDTRGKGVLQQDDVRRLILQWAGSTVIPEKKGAFQPPPMLNPTSLTRDEVISFVQHLDKDGDGHIDITEFCDFIIEGMSLSVSDRDMYSEQSTLHQKLMSIITNVERRLVAMTLSEEGDGLLSTTTSNELNNSAASNTAGKSSTSESTSESTSVQSNETAATATATATATTLGNSETRLMPVVGSEDQNLFVVKEEHYDVALRALFRNYDEKTGTLHADALRELMLDFAADSKDGSLEATMEECNMFVRAMDRDGDGSISEDELVLFFQKGYSLTENKRIKFSQRSAMHSKMMRVIVMTETSTQKRVEAVHQLFVEHDARGVGEMEGADIGRMIRSTISGVEVDGEEVENFVRALDRDGDGSIAFGELLFFFLKGLAQNLQKREEFASRSPFHLKLDLLMDAMRSRAEQT